MHKVILLLGIHGDDTFGADTNWNVVKHSLGELLLHRLHITFIQICT